MTVLDRKIVHHTWISIFIQTCAAAFLEYFLVCYAEFFMKKTLLPQKHVSCCSYNVLIICLRLSIDQSLIHIPHYLFPYSWSGWKQWWRHTVDHHHHTCGRTYRDLQNDRQRSSRVTISFIQQSNKNLKNSNNRLLRFLCGPRHFKHSVTNIKPLFHFLAFHSTEV